MTKLTREQIRQGLDQVPIEVVLMGAVDSKERKLTKKQAEFAKQLVLADSKAEAYRRAYKNKAKPSTASKRGSELSKRGDIQGQAEAFRVALEAERIRTPAMLRALVVNKLTEKVLDENMQDAQHLKALELLGKVSGVDCFVERREVLKLSASVDLKGRLIESLKEAAKVIKDANTIDAESLMAELAALPAPDPAENQPGETPPAAHPPSDN